MLFYDQKPSQILVDLINESNPDLGIGLRQLENTRLTVPRPYPTERIEGRARTIIAFKSGESEWEAPEGVTHVDLLVVGGGGGGSLTTGRINNGSVAGGGGAGGLVFIPNYRLPLKPLHAVRVGEGGAVSNKGGNSHFNDIVAIGGGCDDTPGGSGGGSRTGKGGVGVQSFQFGMSGEYGFGNPGYNSHNGGGGGAGVGGIPYVNDPTTESFGDGGDGLCQVTPAMGPYHKTYRFIDVFGKDYGHLIEDDVWFAGGGGAGTYNYPRTAGGKGGGGAGSFRNNNRYTDAAPGSINTGGGGGGFYDRKLAAAGGSGIVLIAYDNPLTNQEGAKYDNLNTAIDVYPEIGLPVKGKATFYYRRLDVGNIFKHKVIRFDRWQDSNQININTVCDWLNLEYGTAFVPEDFPPQSFTASTAVRTITVVPESYAYIGSLQFIWNPGKRELDQIFESYDIDGMVWDLRHKGEIDNRPLLTFTGYGSDYSEYNDILGSVGNGSVLTTTSTPIGLIVERFNRMYDMELSLSIAHTEPNGLAGLTVTRHTLPNSLVEEANSERFANVMVITSQEDSWFGGRLLFHYNPR